jgi:hypothetical protein
VGVPFRAVAMAGAPMAHQGSKDGSKEGRNVEADEVDDTDVKHLSLD